MSFWGKIWNRKRRVEIPEEFRRMTNVSMKDIIGDVYDSMDVIAKFIHTNKFNFGVTEFSIAPLQCTKRELEKLKREKCTGVSMNRSTDQEGNQRRMDMTYNVHYYNAGMGGAVDIYLSVYVTVSRYRKFNGEADAYIQDMCNLVALGYLKKVYPGLYNIFHYYVEEPTLPALKRQLERKMYSSNQKRIYKAHGTFIIEERNLEGEIDDEDKTVGEILHMEETKKGEKKNETHGTDNDPE